MPRLREREAEIQRPRSVCARYFRGILCPMNDKPVAYDRIRDLSTVKTALPRFLKGAEKSAVLILHGFRSYPGILDYLGGRLHQAGHTVSVPRLPGHGTNASDFRRATWKDWFRRCEDAFLDLRADFETIHVVGSSAGGVLALLLASRYPAAKLLLLAPAIINSNRLIWLTGLLKHFIRRIKDDGKLDGHDLNNPDVQYLADEYWQWMWSKPAHELFKLQRKAKKQLRNITADTLILMTKKDNTVPMKAAVLIERNIRAENVRRVVFEHSNHHLSNHVEKEQVADEAVAWFKR
jgi:carboxylesterase